MIVIEHNDHMYIAESVNCRDGRAIASNVRRASEQNHAPYFVAYGPEMETMTFYGTFRVMELKTGPKV